VVVRVALHDEADPSSLHARNAVMNGVMPSEPTLSRRSVSEETVPPSMVQEFTGVPELPLVVQLPRFVEVLMILEIR
jgi:hypothetical protein